MTYVPTTAATGASTAAAAAAAERARKEEEEMTKYSGEDLDKYEFKIMRSSMGKFSNYETVKRVCDEEAKAGWELVEKFDQYRLRFKRNIEHRANDRHLGFDPYRTSMAGSGRGLTTAIVVGLATLLGIGGIRLPLVSPLCSATRVA